MIFAQKTTATGTITTKPKLTNFIHLYLLQVFYMMLCGCEYERLFRRFDQVLKNMQQNS